MASEVRLIDANALIEDITAAEENAGMGAVVAGTLRRYVNRRPTIDPETLRPKGRWIMDKLEIGNPYDVNSTMVVDIGNCSCCDYRCEMLPIMNYCPNCGADMREG